MQQTTVAAVKDYFRRFVARWPSVADLAAAADGEVMAEWAGLGYYARARNLLACARAVVADHGGAFPDTREELLRLPGIGPYTAAAVASIAFDRRETVLDGNVERVLARRYAVLTPLPDAKPVLMVLASALTPDERPGDYAQAVMDLGATICTPRNPACAMCPWRMGCMAADQGIAADLPAKRAKPVKPTRQGVVWIARQGEGWLVERRPAKGLLGGMLGFPGDDWDGADRTARRLRRNGRRLARCGFAFIWCWRCMWPRLPRVKHPHAVSFCTAQHCTGRRFANGDEKGLPACRSQ